MILYGVVNTAVAPIRICEDDNAGVITEVLFGEQVIINKRTTRWAHITSLIDGVSGWACYKAITPVDESSIQLNVPTAITISPISKAYKLSDHTINHLTLGTRLYNYDINNSTFEVLGEKYFINKCDVNIHNNKSFEEIAKSLMNCSFCWGGRSFFGYDCSGFVQIVLNATNTIIPRHSRNQAIAGEKILSLKDSKPGDCVYFDHSNVEPKNNIVSHCGILLSPNKVIHCANEVHISDIDDTGLYNETQDYPNWYKLNTIRRFEMGDINNINNYARPKNIYSRVYSRV